MNKKSAKSKFTALRKALEKVDIEALLRNPYYQRDLIQWRKDLGLDLEMVVEQFSQGKLEFEDAMKLVSRNDYFKKKYRIPCVIMNGKLIDGIIALITFLADPDGMLIFDNDIIGVRVITHDKKETLQDMENIWQFVLTKCIYNEKFLILRIDLTGKKTEILEYIGYIFDFFSGRTEFEKTSAKSTALDPFLIYDWHHKEGLSFDQITERLQHGYSNYDTGLDARHKQVKRAYKHAVKRINSFNPAA
ncbi:MAG: hypothetical protein ACYDHW_08120 [Syntrophorhabdaceae bacterium]